MSIRLSAGSARAQALDWGKVLVQWLDLFGALLRGGHRA
jgi:hypothetical protein